MFEIHHRQVDGGEHLLGGTEAQDGIHRLHRLILPDPRLKEVSEELKRRLAFLLGPLAVAHPVAHGDGVFAGSQIHVTVAVTGQPMASLGRSRHPGLHFVALGGAQCDDGAGGLAPDHFPMNGDRFADDLREQRGDQLAAFVQGIGVGQGDLDFHLPLFEIDHLHPLNGQAQLLQGLMDLLLLGGHRFGLPADVPGEIAHHLGDAAQLIRHQPARLLELLPPVQILLIGTVSLPDPFQNLVRPDAVFRPGTGDAEGFFLPRAIPPWP